MGRYLVGRLAGIAIVLLIVSIVIFLLMHAIPGGPYEEDKVPLSAAAKANYMTKYGLNKPLVEQYVLYMSHALQGDFGVAVSEPDRDGHRVDCAHMAGECVVGAGGVAGCAAARLFVGGGGGAAAEHVGGLCRLDHGDPGADRAQLCGGSLASAAVCGAAARAADWRLGPVVSLHHAGDCAGAGADGADGALHTRISILEVSRSDFIRTAKAKGLSSHQILWRHTLRNALIPLITVLGPQIPTLITGTIFIESIFRVPGLGKFFVTSILRRDYPMIMALLLLVAVVWSIVYLITDVLYVIVDPRVRLDKKTT